MVNADDAPKELTDLFEQGSLTLEVRDLLGPQLGHVVAIAGSGSRIELHDAERAWAKAAVATLALDIAVDGVDKVDPDRRYIVAPLHEGFADVLALLRLPLDLNWVIREELLDLPFLGPYLLSAGHIAVEPEEPRIAFRRILEATDGVFASGESLVVFPQGSILGIEIGFQGGAFRLAERLNVPVLPVVLTGSHRVWEYPFTTTLRRHQKIRMEVLEPIEPEDAVAQMRPLEREMKRRALVASDAPVRHYDPERDGYWDEYSFLIDPDLPEVTVAGRAS